MLRIAYRASYAEQFVTVKVGEALAQVSKPPGDSGASILGPGPPPILLAQLLEHRDVLGEKAMVSELLGHL